MLGEDLNPLGKALARRGTYKQIATAAFSSPQLKQWLIKKCLTALHKECIGLCSRKNPSILRKSGPDEMNNFSLHDMCMEWKERAPLFYTFLMTCASGSNGKRNDSDWSPAVAMSGSILLKKRNNFMNATSTLVSVMIRQSGIQVICCIIYIIIIIIYYMYNICSILLKLEI